MQDWEQASIQQTHTCSDSWSDISNQVYSTTCSMSKQQENSDWEQ